MNPKELLKFVNDEGIKMIDLRFVDLPGLWQHFSISSKEVDEDMFEEGVGFDGSSIRGFQEIQESDMILIPGRLHGFSRPVHRSPDAQYHLQCQGSGNAPVLFPRPALHRAKG